MTLSVVIPTYNRLPILRRVLQALAEQTVGVDAFEVVVVDDGSTDGTSSTLEEISTPFPLTALSQPNAGPARARNRGVERCRAEEVLFLGDDTIPHRDCLQEHLRARRDNPGCAVLGYTGWEPSLTVTPFMDYINRQGLQFGYDIISDPANVPFNFFYTSNVSLPRSFLTDAGGFNESFPFAAWEDIECAYRMMEAGLRMVYRKEAICLHHHPTTIASFAARQYKSGIAAATMFRLHPELGTFLGVHLAAESGETRSLSLKIKDRLCRALEGAPWFRPHRWYREIMENHYLRGLSAELVRGKLLGEGGVP